MSRNNNLYPGQDATYPIQAPNSPYSPYSLTAEPFSSQYDTAAWSAATSFASPSSSDLYPNPPASSSSSNANPQHAFNPLEHTRLSPSNFDPTQFASGFVTPKFATLPSRGQLWSGSATGSFGGGVGASASGEMLGDHDNFAGISVVEPSAASLSQQYGQEGDASYDSAGGLGKDLFKESMYTGFTPSSSEVGTGGMTGTPSMLMGPPPTTTHGGSYATQARRSFSSHGRPSISTFKAIASTAVEMPASSPVYDLYGSSVVSINPTSPSMTSRMQPHPSTFGQNDAGPSSPFDPEKLGLPMPPGRETGSTNWKGLYSTSGMDMLGVLARVVARPKPEINIGPVDLGCSFLVVDARKFDHPIVYASDTFTRLTGYTNLELLGQNCRFLQSPDGIVSQGEKRKYTDGNAAWHLREHIQAGKESQASLINYCKGGKPFINLVTCIPITWDSDEIAYYVGFQVDLVEQPSAILEKMKNGTYVVNYSVLGSAIIPNPNPTVQSTEPEPPSPSLAPVKIEPAMDVDEVNDVLNTVEESGVEGLVGEVSKKHFNKLLLEYSNDLVYVLSLKGSLLYVSPSAAKMLEYAPSELIGKGISSICHPSDIVAVLRELKDSGSVINSTVSLLYRIRRKHSGYMWIESAGKLHLEQGKGRKCVILVGRARPVYRVSWNDLDQAGGFGGTEFWSKFSLGGMYLYTTPSVKDMLGFASADLIGSSVNILDPSGKVLTHIQQMAAAEEPQLTSVRHSFKTRSGGTVEVTTNLYPSRTAADSLEQDSELTVIAQTKVVSLNGEKRPQLPFPGHKMYRTSSSSTAGGSVPPSPGAQLALPSYRSNSDSDSSSGSSTASFSAIQSTFKTLTTSSLVSDNVFAELDGTRGTSWQFELHQLRLTNKKLREEKAALAALQRKKKRKLAGGGDVVASSPASSDVRRCANCNKSHSPEWRAGPTGPKSLCNSCGLRWAKAKSSAGGSSGTGSPASGSSRGSSGSPGDLVGPPGGLSMPLPSPSALSIGPGPGITSPFS